MLNSDQKSWVVCAGFAFLGTALYPPWVSHTKTVSFPRGDMLEETTSTVEYAPLWESHKLARPDFQRLGLEWAAIGLFFGSIVAAASGKSPQTRQQLHSATVASPA